MKIKKLDELRDVTSTGYVIQRKTRQGTRHPIGAVYQPSTKGDEYQSIRVSGRNAKFHRVLWEAFNGPIPAGMQIDHINGVKNDNRLENLRLVTNAENARGYLTPRKVRAAKYRGVSRCSRLDRWQARIRHNGKDIHIGHFVSQVAAALARDIKALELGFPVEGTNFFSAA